MRQSAIDEVLNQPISQELLRQREERQRSGYSA
jgi:hypothetical protein